MEDDLGETGFNAQGLGFTTWTAAYRRQGTGTKSPKLGPSGRGHCKVSARDLWKAPSMTQGGKGRDERLCWRLSAHVCVGVASLTQEIKIQTNPTTELRIRMYTLLTW